MAQIETTIEIAANSGTVWTAITDLDGVANWNPNVAAASCSSDSAGLGATRTCHLVQGGHIDEVVSEWDDGHRLQFAIGNHGGIRSADMGLEITPTATGTRVTATADYHLAFGPLGPVIDRIAVKRQMTRMLHTGLAGLKEHVETNNQKGMS